MLRNTLIAACAGLSLSIVFAPVASAEGWKANTWQRQIVIKGGKPESFTYTVHTLHTTAVDQPGVMFSCSDNYGLNVLYSYKPVDLLALFTEEQTLRKMRAIPVWIWTGDYKHDSSYYMVRRYDKVMANQKPVQAAIAMGGILQGLPIRIKAQNYFDVTLPLPPLDEEVMAFVDKCEKATEIADKIKAATARKAESE